MVLLRTTRVVLAAAHLDYDPANNRLRNLRSLCQRCHLTHDRPYHLAQRRITYLLRRALGDLFLGPYGQWKPRIAGADSVGDFRRPAERTRQLGSAGCAAPSAILSRRAARFVSGPERASSLAGNLAVRYSNQASR
jgi:hypothetical protein